MTGFGEGAGPWLAFRAGPTESQRGLFFADTYDGAWPYAVHGGHPVVAYEVKAERVLVAANQYALLGARLGLDEAEVRRRKAASGDTYWLRKADAKLIRDARAAGYDAILYTCPTTPTAKRELVVVSAAQCHELGECAPDGTPPGRGMPIR